MNHPFGMGKGNRPRVVLASRGRRARSNSSPRSCGIGSPGRFRGAVPGAAVPLASGAGSCPVSGLISEVVTAPSILEAI